MLVHPVNVSSLITIYHMKVNQIPWSEQSGPGSVVLPCLELNGFVFTTNNIIK